MNFLSVLCIMAAYGDIAISHPTQERLPVPSLPPSSWNTHTYCFDPERHPFKSSRAYTPQAAPLDDLIEQSPADNVMIVQATIEDGYSGLLETLAKGRRDYPGKQILGTISWDPEDPSLKNKTDSEWYKLNDAGVRSVRIHGSYGGSGDDLEWVLGQFLQVAEHCPLERYGWSISSQLPLETWAKMKDSILNHSKLKNISIIADHNGSTTPEDYSTSEFNDFISLMEAGRLHVKIGALHRRSDDIALMEPVIKSFAKAGGIIWGSDWPHVNATAKGLTPAPPLEVDTSEELRLLREWLTNEEWVKMFVFNPARVFGAGKQ
ncbi:amidohydrolase 2 [Fusarium sporotrichioides]|uniref:Amidohydrolase 2 n=1 Tax=Fusarium sporotrichioides TaxID=5514 RepID=A0A395SB27_FUSSP|nr:amidohydrolase 2 [Fusarium sporotrichioides]